MSSETCCPDPCADHDPCLGKEDNRNICVPDKVIPKLPADRVTGRRRLLQTPAFPSNYYPSLYGARMIAAQAAAPVTSTSNQYAYLSVLGPAPVPAPAIVRAPIYNSNPSPAYPTSSFGNAGFSMQTPVGPALHSVPAPAPAPVPYHFSSTANLFAICGSYTCKCGGDGFMTAIAQDHCERCPNPCLSHGDPCKTMQDGRNKCIPDLNVYLRRQSGAGCGGYTCECAPTGWLQPADGQ